MFHGFNPPTLLTGYLFAGWLSDSDSRFDPRIRRKSDSLRCAELAASLSDISLSENTAFHSSHVAHVLFDRGLRVEMFELVTPINLRH